MLTSVKGYQERIDAMVDNEEQLLDNKLPIHNLINSIDQDVV